MSTSNSVTKNKIQSIHTGEMVDAPADAGHNSVHATEQHWLDALKSAWEDLDTSQPGKAITFHIGDSPPLHDDRAILNIMNDWGRSKVAQSEVTETQAHFNETYLYPVLEQAHWAATHKLSSAGSQTPEDRNSRARDDENYGRFVFIVRYEWTDGPRYYEVHMVKSGDNQTGRFRIQQLVQLDADWDNEATLDRQRQYKLINDYQWKIAAPKLAKTREGKVEASLNDENVSGEAGTAAPGDWS